MSCIRNQNQAITIPLKQAQSLACRQQLDFSISARIENELMQNSKFRSEGLQRRVYSTLENLPVGADESPKPKSRKNNRKKRKQRALERLSQAVLNLRDILEDIYCRVEAFDMEKVSISRLIESIPDEKKFYELLNEIIKDLIEDTKEDIWDIVEDKIEQQQCSDLRHKETRKISEWPEFYSFFIDVMYDKLTSIRTSSRQVEKIIYLYNAHYEIKHNHKNTERDIRTDLFRNTFMYMVNSDRLLKRFMKCCQKMFTLALDPEPQHQATYRKLKEMLSVLRPIESDEEEDDDYDDYSCTNSSDSTSNASTDICLEEKQAKKKKKKKKKKEKQDHKTEHQLNCSCSDEEQHDRKLLQFLQNHNVPQTRLPCEFDSGWLRGLYLRLFRNENLCEDIQ